MENPDYTHVPRLIRFHIWAGIAMLAISVCVIGLIIWDHGSRHLGWVL